MKLLDQKTVTKVIETSSYEINGVNPEHAVLQEVVVTSDNEVTINYSVEKTLQGKEYKNYRPLFVVPSFLDELKVKNPFQSNTDFSNAAVSAEFLIDSDNWRLIWVSNWDHTLLDSNLSPLTFLRTYDYLSTFFSDEFIDLNQDFLDWLRSHPWVANKEDIRVERIPHYNQEENRTRFVEVSLYPDAETYAEIVNYAKSRPGRSLCLRELVSGSPCCPKDVPDWFGIRPWLRNPF